MSMTEATLKNLVQPAHEVWKLHLSWTVPVGWVLLPNERTHHARKISCAEAEMFLTGLLHLATGCGICEDETMPTDSRFCVFTICETSPDIDRTWHGRSPIEALMEAWKGGARR